MAIQSTDSSALLLKVVRAGLYAVPFLPLYVSPSLLFPYVSGRNFAFRILTELLLVPFAALCWVSKRHRPSPSRLTVVLLAFVASMALADVLGVNPYRSIWSTYQRMDGLLGLIHFVLFFVLLRTAFETLDDWTPFFWLSIAASSVVALTGLFEHGTVLYSGIVKRPSGTIGNAGIFAAYLMLHVFLCFLVLQGQRRARLRGFLIASVCLDLLMIYVSGTRAPLLALLIVCPALAVAWYGWRRTVALATPRFTRGWVLLAVLGLVSLLVLRGIPLGQNFTRMTLGTGQSPRRIAWSTAWHGIRERVWTGWGQENFSVVWDRYYIPAGENFDRAHNVILDSLLDGGLLALGTFVAMMVALAVSIRSISRHDRGVALALGGFVASYLIVDMLWFDTFETYCLLISVMAFADRYERSLGSAAERTAGAEYPARGLLSGATATAAVGVVVITAVYVVNLRPMLLAHHVVSGLDAWVGKRSLAESRAHFERAFSYPGLRSPEAVEQMAALVPEVVAARASTDPAEVRLFVDRAIRGLAVLTSSPVAEVKHLRLLGVASASASALVPAYRTLAIESFNRALLISPNNEQTYAALAGVYAADGDFDAALAMQRRAIQLAPVDASLQMGLAPLALRAGRAADVELGIFRRNLAHYTALAGLAAGYVRSGDLELASIVLEEMRRRDPNNPELLELSRTIAGRLTETKGAAPR